MNLVQRKVREIVSQLGTNEPETIARIANIEISEALLPCRIRGILYNSPDYTEIVLNSNLSHSQRRAALAHELGHFFLHPSIRFSMLLTDRQRHSKWEHQADQFAAYLLIDMDKPPEWMALWELAERFDVPEGLLRLRFCTEYQSGGAW